MPPIINSRATKIQEDTKDIFVEITALDETKAKIVLNMLIANFATYTNFEVYSINVIDEINNETRTYPLLEEVTFHCELE